ncbi:MAG TPA: cytochrome c4 [Burkholderiaceae bacterium]|nr:cytochrome c4 [Burkholderiaceae bacterium]
MHRLALALALFGAACFTVPAAGQQTAPPVRDTMAQRMQACTVCHGKEGRATREGYFPRIAGKPAGYLYNQLVNFRTGRRTNATMAYFTEHMSEAYLREIATYFATLDLPYPPAEIRAVPAEEMRRGFDLVKQGDASRGIPACGQCHGERMTGVEPAMPGLLGLSHHYLVGQLGAWRNGLRRAAPPDCMAEIAKRLSSADVVAVAAWLSSQQITNAAKPAAQVESKPPIECGSGFK